MPLARLQVTVAGRGRFLLETAASGLAAALAALTLVTRDWIEKLIGLDPDRSSGAAEWALVALLALAAMYLSFRARRHWREIHAPPLG